MFNTSNNRDLQARRRPTRTRRDLSFEAERHRARRRPSFAPRDTTFLPRRRVFRCRQAGQAQPLVSDDTLLKHNPSSPTTRCWTTPPRLPTTPAWTASFPREEHPAHVLLHPRFRLRNLYFASMSPFFTWRRTRTCAVCRWLGCEYLL